MRNDCRGFTLIEMAVVLVIVGAVTAMAVTSGYAVIATARFSATQQKMAAIDQALLAYRTSYDRLPCPGDLTLASTSANYGKEANAGTGSSIAVGAGTCTGGTPAANFTAASVQPNNTATAAEGAVPTVTLGLPNDFMYDGWGNKFRYAVDISFTGLNVFPISSPACVTGALTLYDSSGSTARSKGAIYALLSHGAHGHGAYTPGGGGTPVNGGSSNANELVNCHCTATGAASTYAATYVQQDPAYQSGHAGAANYYFDDIVTYKERWQMPVAWDMAASSNSCILIAVADDYNTRVQIFDGNGKYLRQFGGPVSFLAPISIAFDASGSIWVGDQDTETVMKFNSSGSYMNFSLGSYGTGPGQFSDSGPSGIAFDASGSIWVAEYGQYRVEKFNASTGSYLSAIGTGYNGVGGTIGQSDCGATGGRFCGQAIGVAVDKAGSIWADAANGATISGMQVFNSSGTFVRGACSPSECDSIYGLGGMTSDASGNIWVTDFSQSVSCNGSSPALYIQQYNASGTEQIPPSFGSNACGTGNGQLNGWTINMAVDTSGSIWVSTMTDHRVQKFNSSGSFLLGIGSGYNGAPGAIGSNGAGNGQLDHPTGIAAGTSR